MSRLTRASFVVRVVSTRGRVNGVIERVATGEKEAFADTDAIGPLIRKMLAANPRTPPARDKQRAD